MKVLSTYKVTKYIKIYLNILEAYLINKYMTKVWSSLEYKIKI